jgi:hypothetical protein
VVEIEMKQQAEDYSSYLDEVESEHSSMKNFKKRVLAYMAGYVSLKLTKRVLCGPCKLALESSPADRLDPSVAGLLNRKNRKQLHDSSNEHFIQLCKDGLVIPSNSVYEVVVKAEAIFQIKVAKLTVLPQTENLIPMLVPHVTRLLSFEKLFPTLNNHVLNQNSRSEEPHNLALCKLVITRYLEVRCKSYCKVVNEGFRAQPSTRNRNLKLSHNKHE